jgi:hypothetical protein
MSPEGNAEGWCPECCKAVRIAVGPGICRCLECNGVFSLEAVEDLQRDQQEGE